MKNGVILSTKEKELGVKYGSKGCFIRDDYEHAAEYALNSFKDIFNDLNDIRNSYISLGFHLRDFELHCYYMDFGYNSLTEFCEANFGLDKSFVSRCLSVYKTFTVFEGGVHKMQLDDKYKNYSYSQLCEMLSMSDKERKQIKPDMTIKQIREIKKNSAALGKSLDDPDRLSDVSRNVSPVATSQQNKFYYGDYAKKNGIVLYNYIKSLTLEKTTGLTIFDQNGKEIYCDVVDLLYDGIGGIYIRLRNDDGIVKAFDRE